MLGTRATNTGLTKMTTTMRHALVFLVVIGGLLAAGDANALRCGNKIVRDGMHEAQVIAICGEPATRRDIGRTFRAPDVYARRPGDGYPLDRYYPGIGSTEVVVTEYIYNFGPRRLMRRMIFEGGLLVEIESLGYGYIEK